MQKIRHYNINADVYMEHIDHTFLFQDSGIIVEEIDERLQEPEAMGGYKETVCYRHSRVAARMSSQWL